MANIQDAAGQAFPAALSAPGRSPEILEAARSNAIKESMKKPKFDALEHYRTSPLFTDAERAALDYLAELTRDKKVDPATFAHLADHYSEREICEIVWLVASEHLYNMTNIGRNIHSDMLCSRRRSSFRTTRLELHQHD